jgi:peptide/nickel transport system permease protein
MSRVVTLPSVGKAPESAPLPRSFYAQAFRQTFNQWSARAGLAWLGILAVLAVFGPLLANSSPYWVQTQAGESFSPMWRSMTATDLALLSATLLGILALALRPVLPWLRRWWWAVAVWGLAAGFLGGLAKGTPVIGVYERYREMERAGELVSVYRAPIPFSPNDRNRDTPGSRQQPPSWAGSPADAAGFSAAGGTEGQTLRPYFTMGSDREGSDVASRLIYASRTALAIGFVATGIAAVIGVIVGGLMGYFAGWLDIIGMRLIEIIEAIPRLMLLLAVAAIFNADIFLLMVLIGLTGWMGNARFIRAEFLRLRKQDFVQAAEALGLPLHSILFKHLLPNGVTPVLVSVSFGVAGAILIESTLAFLGIGRPDQPSWGQLLNQAREGGAFQWWIAVFPGGMIFLTVFSYQLIGEALRDALDPKLKKRD